MRKAQIGVCAVLLVTIAGCDRRPANVAAAAAPAPAAAATTPSALAASTSAAPAPLGTLEEFKARFQKHLMRADTDHDGRVSRQEWTTFRAAHPGKGGDPAKQFERLDTNHDGFLTPDEINAAAAKAYARRSQQQSPEAEAPE